MRFFILSLTVAAASLAGVAGAAEIALTGENTKITFVGTKPEGKHEGGFKTVTGTATTGADPTALKLAVEIDVTSMHSDDEKLTGHLKSPDFFDVKNHPKAKFVSTKVEKAGDGYTVSGSLTLLGKTKPVTFPAKISTTDGLSLTSTFKIDRTEWGMTYGKGKIDDAVGLTVSISAK
jgi:polyisoprenoid-binding protein YceI